MDDRQSLVGSYAPDFELPGTDGEVHHLARYLQTFQAVGVVFLSNQCSYVQGYLDRLKAIQTRFSTPQFLLIGINANDAAQCPEEDLDSMKAFAAQHELTFPYLRDVTQDVARGFQVQATPHAFLLDPACMIRYDGGIDDSPEKPEAVKETYLESAIGQLLNQQAITIPATSPQGGAILWRP